MRRISLAVALLGAIAGAGCSGGSNPSSSGSSKGVPGSTYTVVVRGDGTSAAVTGGRVTSGDGAIDCGVGAATQLCTADFPWGTTVVLTAAPDTAGGYNYFGFAGSCSGTGTCTLSGNADKTVLVRFFEDQWGHPNFSDAAIHAPAYVAFKSGAADAYQCTSCHGANLQGQGLALSCSTCHANPYQPPTTIALEPNGVVGLVTDASGAAVPEGTVYFVPAADVAALSRVTVPVPAGGVGDPNVDRDEPLEDLIRVNGASYTSAPVGTDGVYTLASLPAGSYFVTFKPATETSYLPGGSVARVARASTALVGTRLDVKVSGATPSGASFVGSGTCIGCHGRAHISSTMHRLGIWSPYAGEAGVYQDLAARPELFNALNTEFTAGDATSGGTTVYFYDFDSSRGFDKYKTSKTRPTNPAPPADWAASTAYAKGNRVSNGGRAYEATVAGTSGATGPSGTGSAIVDGGVTWKYINPNLSFSARVYNSGTEYLVEIKNEEGAAESITRRVDTIYGGGVHKQRYQTKIYVDGTFRYSAMIPLQFNQEGAEGSAGGRGRTSQVWRDYYGNNWFDQGTKLLKTPAVKDSFEKNCISCHAAGVQVTHNGTLPNGSDATAFTAITVADAVYGDFDYDGNGVKEEMNIGCETCHGPGSAHAFGKKIVSPSLLTPEREVMICAQCHTRPQGAFASDMPVNTAGKMMIAGTSRAAFLAGYATTQGDGKAGDFWGAANDNQSKSHHQQASDFIRSDKYRNASSLMTCSSCHDLHARNNPRQLRQDPTSNAALCGSCHTTPNADLPAHIGASISYNHAPQAPKCTDCHMAKVSQSGAGAAPAAGAGITGADTGTKYWWGDISSHTFAAEGRFPRKERSRDSTPTALPTAYMNPCGGCHSGFGL